MKSSLEVWLPRDPFVWPARSPCPREKARGTASQKGHEVIHRPAPAPRGREERQTHIHTRSSEARFAITRQRAKLGNIAPWTAGAPVPAPCLVVAKPSFQRRADWRQEEPEEGRPGTQGSLSTYRSPVPRLLSATCVPDTGRGSGNACVREATP